MREENGAEQKRETVHEHRCNRNSKGIGMIRKLRKCSVHSTVWNLSTLAEIALKEKKKSMMKYTFSEGEVHKLKSTSPRTSGCDFVH